LLGNIILVKHKVFNKSISSFNHIPRMIFFLFSANLTLIAQLEFLQTFPNYNYVSEFFILKIKLNLFLTQIFSLLLIFHCQRICNNPFLLILVIICLSFFLPEKIQIFFPFTIIFLIEIRSSKRFSVMLIVLIKNLSHD
jgi:hypothetical protein